MSNKELRVALVGQPNSGKSTLFNAVAGFKVNTGNFAGTTVTYAETRVTVGDTTICLIDLPGTYSMTSLDLAEKVTRDYLLSDKIDVIINVVDASMLARSLELTIQLIEMRVPMILACNMMDEAKRKGIELNPARLQELTGLQVFEIVAVLGSGVEPLFTSAVQLKKEECHPIRPTYDRDVEQCIQEIAKAMPPQIAQTFAFDRRFVAIRLLEIDEQFEERIAKLDSKFLAFARSSRKKLAELHGWPEETVFASHRHAVVLDLYEKIAIHRHGSQGGLREKLDGFLTNPLGGMITILGSLFLMFFVSFWLGDQIASFLSAPFDLLHQAIQQVPQGILQATASGLSDGIEAGIGIVLPYLVPLLFLLAIYEDSGFLPRIAFMADGILHRFGLHGKSIVPLILGCGCNVPALMATRNLENERDRRLAMLIIPFITCSARTVVILGLVGKYLGAAWATVIYIGSIVIAMLVSYLLSKVNVGNDTGIIMEVPPLRVPQFRILLKKVWLRLYEFLVRAWPIIVISSILLSLAGLAQIDVWINAALSPLTVSVMKLPMVVGITLFLGFFRKELALAMLITALGTSDIASVLSSQQILTLTIFTVLYIPCLATLTTLKSEGGWRLAGFSAALNFGVAVLVAGIVAHIPTW